MRLFDSKKITKGEPSRRIFWAFDTNVGDKILMLSQVHRNTMRSFKELPAVCCLGSVLNDQINLVRGATDTQDIVLGISSEQINHTAVPTGRCVLSVRPHRNKLGTPSSANGTKKRTNKLAILSAVFFSKKGIKKKLEVLQ